MSIGDFAARTGLSVSAVRFYADRGLLPPARVDAVSGYRLYTKQQVETGKLIRDLRRMNMSLADIGNLLSADAPERSAFIQHHLRTLEEELRHVHIVAARFDTDDGANAISTTEKSTMQNITANSTEFATALKQVLPAAGTNPHRPDLMTVLIEAASGSIRVVATDSHRCVIRDLVPLSPGEDFSAVMSAATMREWQESLDHQAANPTAVTIQRDKNLLAVSGEQIDLQAPAIDMAFPPYEAVLSAAAPTTTIIAAKADLLAALSGFEGIGPVKLTAAGNTLSIGDGQHREELAITCDHETSVSVNPRFAEDAVQHAVGAEVIVEIDGPLDPLVFRSADDGTYTSLLMPVKDEG